MLRLVNVGYATYSQIFAPAAFTDFDLGFHQFDPFLFSADKIKYYYAIHPMTQLQYNLGLKVVSKWCHYRIPKTLLHNWNVGIDFSILRSTGFYTHPTY